MTKEKASEAFTEIVEALSEDLVDQYEEQIDTVSNYINKEVLNCGSTQGCPILNTLNETYDR